MTEAPTALLGCAVPDLPGPAGTNTKDSKRSKHYNFPISLAKIYSREPSFCGDQWVPGKKQKRKGIMLE